MCELSGLLPTSNPKKQSHFFTNCAPISKLALFRLFLPPIANVNSFKTICLFFPQTHCMKKTCQFQDEHVCLPNVVLLLKNGSFVLIAEKNSRMYWGSQTSRRFIIIEKESTLSRQGEGAGSKSSCPEETWGWGIYIILKRVKYSRFKGGGVGVGRWSLLRGCFCPYLALSDLSLVIQRVEVFLRCQNNNVIIHYNQLKFTLMGKWHPGLSLWPLKSRFGLKWAFFP